MTTVDAPAAAPVADRLSVTVPVVGRKAPDALSPSGTGRYENCPLSYYLYAVARIPEPATEAACRGTFVHRVLEALHALPPTARTVDAARRLAAEARQVFDHGADALVDPDEDEIRSADGDRDSYQSLNLTDEQQRSFRWSVWRAIESYFQLEDPTRVHVVAVEQRVNGHIGDVPARGIVDRLDRRRDGQLVVTDYKTGKPPRPGTAHYRARQLASYALLVRERFGQAPALIRLMYLDSSPPTSGQHQERGPVAVELRTSSTMLRQATDWFRKAWDGIHTDLERGAFDATPNRLCDWCVHKPNCPAWGGDIGVALLDARPPAGEPLPFPS